MDFYLGRIANKPDNGRSVPKFSVAVLAAAVGLLCFPALSTAATLISPTDGAIFRPGETLRLEWSLAPGERGARFFMASTSELSSPAWTAPAGDGSALMTDTHVVYDYRIPKDARRDTFSWRLCVATDGQASDDQCTFTETRHYVIPPDPACSDGIDNDGDGKRDLADRSCLNRRNGKSEAGQVPDCFDGVDNDGDGLKDYPRDPGCRSDADSSEVDRRRRSKRHATTTKRRQPSKPSGHGDSITLAEGKRAIGAYARDFIRGMDEIDTVRLTDCYQHHGGVICTMSMRDEADGITCTLAAGAFPTNPIRVEPLGESDCKRT